MAVQVSAELDGMDKQEGKVNYYCVFTILLFD